MANRGFTEEWIFKDDHLDPNISAGDENKFLSAARCILYVAPSDKATGTGTFTRVGVVQGYNWGENKQMEMVFELGSDIPYYIPGRTTGQIQIQRILLSGEDFLNLIYNGDTSGGEITPERWIRSLRDINIPLDMMFVFYGQGKSKKYDTKYSRLFKNCWIQSRQESINAGQILVAESISVVYEYCSDLKFSNGK